MLNIAKDYSSKSTKYNKEKLEKKDTNLIVQYLRRNICYSEHFFLLSRDFQKLERFSLECEILHLRDNVKAIFCVWTRED
jgi:hypothetical protein